MKNDLILLKDLYDRVNAVEPMPIEHFAMLLYEACALTVDKIGTKYFATWDGIYAEYAPALSSLILHLERSRKDYDEDDEPYDGYDLEAYQDRAKWAYIEVYKKINGDQT